MFGLGTWEVLLILVVALVFLGPQKLPEIAKSLGKGVRQMRQAMDGLDREVRDAGRYEPPASDGRPPQVEASPEEDVAMHAAAGDVMRDAHRPPQAGPDDLPGGRLDGRARAQATAAQASRPTAAASTATPAAAARATQPDEGQDA